MKLERLKVTGYKNLKELEIFFNVDSSINVLIGSNGSGKSNCLEALTLIFKSFYENSIKELGFDFEIEYLIYSKRVLVVYCSGVVEIKIDDTLAKHSDLLKLLPDNVFTYYSGSNVRLKSILFDKSFEKYKRDIRRGGDIDIRKMLYLEDYHALLGFISSYVYDTKGSRKICFDSEIEKISKLTIKFKKPEWSKKTDDRFYGAIGGTRDFLEGIVDYLELGGEYVDYNSSNNIIILETTDIRDSFIGNYQVDELFANLDLLYLNDMILDIELFLIKNGSEISFNEISEGEKQFILINSLSDITNNSGVLYLLDEPDTYLHPSWQRELTTELISAEFNGQLILTTHSPLTIGALDKNSVKILKDGRCFEPSSNSLNRDISDIIEEIMEVSPRPRNVMELIEEFNTLIGSKNLDEAKKKLEVLRTLLTPNDPFWNGADSMITRLEILG